jgi:hypothetical protein
MSHTLTILLGIAMAAVVLVLATGVASFAKGGEWYRRNANRLLMLRVAAQVVAVLLLAALILFGR